MPSAYSFLSTRTKWTYFVFTILGECLFSFSKQLFRIKVDYPTINTARDNDKGFILVIGGGLTLPQCAVKEAFASAYHYDIPNATNGRWKSFLELPYVGEGEYRMM